MIEDPEITLEILEYFSRDEVPYPANKTVEDLLADDELSEVGRQKLEYHVHCAIQSGLLDGISEIDYLLDGPSLFLGYLLGLTQEGGEYVRNAQSSFKKKAVEWIKTEGLPLTTQTLTDVLKNMITSAISG